jgi:hypothetical protein
MSLCFGVLLLCWSAGVAAQPETTTGPPEYPPFESTVDSLLDRYTLPDVSGQYYLRLLRAPRGYYVTVAQPGEIGELGQAHLFWSRETATFQALPFPPRDSTDLEHLASFEYNFRDAEKFRQYLYFGYYGYEMDAIRTLDSFPTLGDQQLLQLGRAYADLAMNRLGNQYGYSNPAQRFALGTPPQALSPTQLAAYRRWQHAAIRQYRRLHEHNPDYELIVGDPYTKYSNEVMTAYLTLWQYQDEATAAAELRDSLYGPGLLAFARGLLTDMPPDGLLFCGGDNDFYPLLYLQKHHGVRPDVTLISYPLLQSPIYRTALHRYGLEFFVPDRLNARDNLAVTFPDKQAEPLSLDSLFGYLADSTLWRNSPTAGPASYLALPANRYRNDQTRYTISEPYVLRRSLNLMELIHRYGGQRPICFSGVAASFFRELWIDSEEWQAHGMLYRWVPGASLAIDTTTAVTQLLRGYGDFSAAPVRRQFRPFAQRYLQATVATALVIADSTMARQLLDSYRLALPLSFHLSEPASVQLATAYGVIGDHQTGIRLARSIALHHLNHPAELDPLDRERLVDRLTFVNREWQDPDLTRYLRRLANE